MSMAHIRERYGVPAKRGANILHTDDTGKFIYGFLYVP